MPGGYAANDHNGGRGWHRQALRIFPGAVGSSVALPRRATLPLHLLDDSCSRDSDARQGHLETRRLRELLSKGDTKAASYPSQAGQSQIQEPSCSTSPWKIKSNRSIAPAVADWYCVQAGVARWQRQQGQAEPAGPPSPRITATFRNVCDLWGNLCVLFHCRI